MQSREHVLPAVAVGAVSFIVFGILFRSFEVLYDTDSYYHLAIGRAYAHLGVVDVLPWARLSLLHEGFGDKEFLFHVLLMPFSGGDPASTAAAGRWALALLNAVAAGSLAWLGAQAAGRWGLLLPVLVYAGSLDFLGRAIRLRPELLSLLLLLAATVCVGRSRYRLLGVTAVLYALSYTAFHAFLGLAFGWFVVRGWMLRRWDARLLLYPVLGVGLGLLVHPHFPHNLLVWKVQSVDFFALKGVLDVGREIQPPSADRLLLENVVWGLALLALWRSGRKTGGHSEATSEMALALHVVTASFGLLYLLMGRFSIYFVPFASLSLLYEMRRQGRVVGRDIALPGRGRVPLAWVLAVLVVVAGVRAGDLAAGLASSSGPVGREDEWAAFGAAVPPGETVAAEWGSTHIYMFWAPQATYLNVLDPVFMAVPFPEAHRAERALFEGREPDVPLALERNLASRFLALSRFHPHPELMARLVADPRLEKRYEGYTLLYEAVPGRNADFLLDWYVVPQERAARGLPAGPSEAIDGWPRYPRAATPRERALEAFVDLDRLTQDRLTQERCHALVFSAPESPVLELSSYGPTTLWLDDRVLLSASGSERATLGRGLQFQLPPDILARPGEHRLTVRTCRPGDGERGGFYLRRITG